MNKAELISYLDEAEKFLICNGAENDILQPRFAERKKSIEEFSAKILFVGEFSAGKSALLNSFLGDKEILREDIPPETAVSAELIYSPVEKIICVTDSGERHEYALQDAEKISVKNCDKCTYCLNNARLKNIGDLIPVDMPGFNSGIESHNKALLQYLGDAAAYVFVVNLEKGTIGQSTLDFLDEIKAYSTSIAFVLTKSDKLLPADVEKIASDIKTTLEGLLGERVPIVVTSKHDSDCGAKIAALLNNFSADELLLQKLGNKVVTLIRQAVQTLEMQLSALTFNPHDLDLAIRNQEQKRDSVIVSMRREKKKLHNSLQTEVPNKILQDVEAALKNQIETLVYSAQQGSTAFNSAVNNIVRPVILQSTQQNIDASFDSYIGKVVELSQNEPIDVDKAEGQLRRTAESLRAIAEGGKIFAEFKKYKRLYQISSTGVALTTSVVAPWLELIIIFLPDIIGALNNFLGRSKEAKLKECIEREVIPQICEKLRPEIREALLRVEDERLTEIEEEFQVTLDNEISALQQLKDEKEHRLTNIEQKKTDLAASIQKLEEIIGTIERA